MPSQPQSKNTALPERYKWLMNFSQLLFYVCLSIWVWIPAALAYKIYLLLPSKSIGCVEISSLLTFSKLMIWCISYIGIIIGPKNFQIIILSFFSNLYFPSQKKQWSVIAMLVLPLCAYGIWYCVNMPEINIYLLAPISIVALFCIYQLRYNSKEGILRFPSSAYLRRLGVVTSVTVSVPALAFAFIALIPDYKYYPQLWETNHSELKLDEYTMEAIHNKHDLPMAHVFIIDVSKTFRIDPYKSSRQSNPCNILRKTYLDCLELIESAKSSQGGYGIISEKVVHSEDTAFVFLLCKQLFHVSAHDNPIRNGILPIKFEGELPNICSDLPKILKRKNLHQNNALEAWDERTDFVYCLSELLKYFEAESYRYSHINFTIMSDFVHDPSKTKITSDDRDKANEITDFILKNKKLSVTALVDFGLLKERGGDFEAHELDFLPYLKSLPEEKFKQVDLVRFFKEPPICRTKTVLNSLYPTVHVKKPLFLRHNIDSANASCNADATVIIPDAFGGKVYIELENPENLSLNAIVQFVDEDEGKVLDLTNRERFNAIGDLHIRKSEGSKKLIVGLKHYYTISRNSDLRMILSFPEEKINYEIPLRIMPAYPEQMKALLKILLILLGVAPITIALVLFFRSIAWFDKQRRMNKFPNAPSDASKSESYENRENNANASDSEKSPLPGDEGEGSNLTFPNTDITRKDETESSGNKNT